MGLSVAAALSGVDSPHCPSCVSGNSDNGFGGELDIKIDVLIALIGKSVNRCSCERAPKFLACSVHNAWLLVVRAVSC